MKPTKHYRPGHVIQIPLKDGRYGYALYVMRSGWGAAILWIFDPIRENPITSFDELERRFLLAPTQVFLGDTLLSGECQSLGRYPQKVEMAHPTFRLPVANGQWRLWSGGDFVFVDNLPHDGETLEFDEIYAMAIIEERLRNGWFAPMLYPLRRINESENETSNQ